jgi:hypothetical protein
MGGACSTSGRDDAYETLVRKPEWKRRPRRRLEDIIRMDVREIRWAVVDCDSSGSGLGPMADYREHGNDLRFLKRRRISY